jgi:hypothetical protein
MSNDNASDPRKIERLSVLMRDDGVDPETMDAAQVAQYLKDQKVDLSGPQKRLGVLLKKAKARQTLERARERRLRAVEKAKAALSTGLGAAEIIREKVRSMIESLGQHDPGQAQVYAREFEKATPEDLAVLAEDLTLLEMEASEDGKGDPQNPR